MDKEYCALKLVDEIIVLQACNGSALLLPLPSYFKTYLRKRWYFILPQDDLIKIRNILETKPDGCTCALSDFTAYSLHMYAVNYATIRN